MEKVELEKYNPLSRIICYDDFDHGLNGWVPLTPNLKEDEIDYFPSQRRHIDWGAPMLSSATFGYVGTHGSMSGTYSMKVPTRPVAAPSEELPVRGSLGIAIKRLTIPAREPLRIEMYFALKAEQDRPGIGEEDIRAFGFTWDIQDDERRYFCGVRYMNSANGKLQQRWQYLKASEGTDEEWGEMGESAVGSASDRTMGKKVYIKRGLGGEHLGRRYEDGSGDGFAEIPDSYQPLCYNETIDKINWQYFSFTMDLEKREYLELRCSDKVFDLSGIQPTIVDPYPRINQLLNPLFWVETDTNRRVFLFIDSIVISCGTEGVK
jgi:hypothetical protein